MTRRFALTGIAGYIAAHHLRAIRDTGNQLVAAADPHDSVGILDSYFPEAMFFTEFERFDRHLEKLRRHGQGVQFLSVCSPNYLHDAHIRLALRLGADAICEKPLVLNPWNLDALAGLEATTGRKVYTVLQLRMHPALVELREKLEGDRGSAHRVKLHYVTARGPWYRYSWKGDPQRSGGVIYNIGIHCFDMLMWLFGGVREVAVEQRDEVRAGGFLVLERAEVEWFLSIDRKDLPFQPKPGEPATCRSITVDGRKMEFSGGFTGLHTAVYAATLAGRGVGIEEARPSIELAHRLRNMGTGTRARF